MYNNIRIKLRFSRSIIKQNKVTYSHGPIANIYVVYRLIPDTKCNDFILENCLFGAVKLTRNADISIYKYSGYGIRLHSKKKFYTPK